MQKTKVSVIIPIYGVEQYIARCAQSLFNQTLDEVEFIFVDDHTQDNSIVVLEREIQKFPHLKDYIKIQRHEKNYGLPIARQTGLRYANGEYIIHCDSDDWMDKNMLKLMYDKALASNCDIVVCDYFVSDGTTQKEEAEYVPDSTNQLLRSLLSKQTHSVVWNKLVHRRLYEKTIKTPTANNAEDYALICQLSYYCTKVCCIKQPLYYYYHNAESMTKVKSKEHVINRFMQSYENIKLVESFLQERGVDSLYINELDYIKSHEKKLLLPYVQENDVLCIWRSYYQEVFPRILFNKILTIRDKIRYIITAIGIYPKVKSLLK